jgi:hypothetical protein
MFPNAAQRQTLCRQEPQSFPQHAVSHAVARSSRSPIRATSGRPVPIYRPIKRTRFGLNMANPCVRGSPQRALPSRTVNSGPSWQTCWRPNTQPEEQLVIRRVPVLPLGTLRRFVLSTEGSWPGRGSSGSIFPDCGSLLRRADCSLKGAALQ